ncbi:hypothetical protein [Psychrobacter sp. I-STPA10]|uniref:hypothetical protein n=1 Tax=Psychrobacter sp. I-STPA10 TaxID=2585769 RepID=UPI001E327CEE|nr:hypothetical protein [Psychrobacter sp. I-STPA10]
MMDINSNGTSSLSQSVKLPIIVKVIGRIVISVLIAAFGFCLAFMSTVGPTIAPEVWAGDLDMLIRLSVLGLGFLTMIAAVIWLVFPMLKWVFTMFKEQF